MIQFFREAAPFVRRHPGIFFAGFFCPWLIVGTAILSVFGIPKQPHDVAVILLRVLVSCGLVELGLVIYRELTSAHASKPD
jgi:predicted signal transduction protein with EAL and GGDEF domain